MIGSFLRRYQPRNKPTFVQSSNVGANGGNINILGTGFVNQTYGLTVAPWVYIAGLNVTAKATYVSSTKIVVNLPNTYTVGTYDVWIVNPDGGYVFSANAITVSASSDPSTILGADLAAWYRAGDVGNTLSGSTYTGVVDKAANGNAPTTLTSVTKTAADSTFNGEDSFTFNGTTSILSVSSFTAGTAIFTAMPMYLATAGNNVYFAHLGAIEAFATSSTTGVPIEAGTTGTATWGSSITASLCQIYGYCTTTEIGVSVNNATPVTATTVSTPASGQVFSACCHYISPGNFGNFVNGRTPDIVVARIKPTAQQMLDLAIYFNLRYQLTSAPTISLVSGVPQVTKLGTAGGSFRISGANIAAGCTITLGGGLSGTTVTATQITSSIVDCSIPASTYTAGSYSITITNPDGGASTTLNALTVTATDDVMTIMGTDCIFWVEGDQMTVSGGLVTAALDKSLRGSDPTTLTQIAYTATDSDFNNRPSFAFSSASSSVFKTAVMPLASASACFALVGMKITTGTTNGGAWAYYAGTDAFQCDQENTISGSPRNIFGGIVDNWGHSITNLSKSVYAYQTGGTAINTGLAVNFGTEVTGSATSTAASPSQAFALGAKTTGANVLNGKMCVAIFCRIVPSSGQLTALKNMLSSRFSI